MHKLKEKLHLGHSDAAHTDSHSTTHTTTHPTTTSALPATSTSTHHHGPAVARPGDLVQDTTTVVKEKEVTLEKNPKVVHETAHVDHDTKVIPTGHNDLHLNKEHKHTHTAAPVVPAVQSKSVPVVPLSTAAPSQVKSVAAPVVVEKTMRPTVVQESIHPIEKEEIQPVIHREREQTEIQRMTEHLHETKIAPTLVQEKVLPAQVMAVESRGGAVPAFVAPKGGVNIDTTQRTQVVHQPIVEETVRKTIIEEVQPVLHRDVVAPTVIKEVQPIYEKIIEPTIVRQSELPVKEVGVRQEIGRAPLNSELPLNTAAPLNNNLNQNRF